MNASDDDFGAESDYEVQSENDAFDNNEKRDMFEGVPLPEEVPELGVSSNIENVTNPAESQVNFNMKTTRSINISGQIEDNPAVMKYINELVNKKVDKKISEMQEGRGNSDHGSNNVTPTKDRVTDRTNIVKSPSDTTLYTPALRKVTQDNAIIDKISTFVESTRMDSSGGDCHRSRELSRSRTRSRSPDRNVPEHNVMVRQRSEDNGTQARGMADNIILQAEKFRAEVMAPKGENPLGDSIDFNLPKFETPEEVKFKHMFDNDDDFFHVTSHIDKSLKTK